MCFHKSVILIIWRPEDKDFLKTIGGLVTRAIYFNICNWAFTWFTLNRTRLRRLPKHFITFLYHTSLLNHMRCLPEYVFLVRKPFSSLLFLSIHPCCILISCEKIISLWTHTVIIFKVHFRCSEHNISNFNSRGLCSLPY